MRGQIDTKRGRSIKSTLQYVYKRAKQRQFNEKKTKKHGSCGLWGRNIKLSVALAVLAMHKDTNVRIKYI